MCGVAGFLGAGGSAQALKSMIETLAYRGPDDQGMWVDGDSGIFLGHRRLAILDTSNEGHQPMVSPSGRFVIAYNGEIYNHMAMRADLLSVSWRGHSDTETLLASIDQWGVEGAISRSVGMFAFALWDRERKELTLARDRLGIKPMCYGQTSSGIVFASELNAIRQFPEFDDELSQQSIALLLRYNSIPAPHTIYKKVYKVRPGTMLRFRLPSDREPKELTYWSAKNVALNAQSDPFKGTAIEATDQLEEILKDAVGQRMLSDVPLGAFLSGGVDSSTVVALMQAQSNQPIRTYSIGSRDVAYDEAPDARSVAEYLGTDHTELYVSSQAALDVVPRLAAIYDEPFADSSQIPTFLVSQLARKSVTVALSGDGGDELFAGYNRHIWAARIWRQVGWLPRPVRVGIARGIHSVPPRIWDKIAAVMGSSMPAYSKHRRPGFKLHKLARGLSAVGYLDFYLRLASLWSNPSSLMREAAEEELDLELANGLSDRSSQIMLLDLVRYLPDDILCKVDRASMAASLEARVPLLDHRVVEYAWRLPIEFKLHKNQSKWILRQVLYRYVPRDLIERPKAGFGVPIGSWIRGPLREWAEALLDEKRLNEQGYLDPAPIRSAWKQHLAGSHSWEHELWVVLMFQQWLDYSSQK